MTISGMTGFSSVRGAHGGTSWAWEAKSVNGRSLDVRVRTPAGYEGLEEQVRQAVAKRFKRGSFQLNLSVEAEQTPIRYRVNEALLESLLSHCRGVVERGLATPPSVDGLLSVKGVLEQDSQNADEGAREALIAVISASLEEVLIGLEQARRREGEALQRILGDIVGSIAGYAQSARAVADAAPAVIHGKLRGKLEELLGEFGVDPARLAQEAALLALKADVREELDRLDAHVGEARKLLQSGSGQGRRLDFLAQEFNREANTLCSKSSSTELTRIGLDLKTAVDQLREQAQNVE